jgi:Family of unknown function (DUF6152)
MSTRFVAGVVTAAVLLAAPFASAHHSVAGQFDVHTSVELAGVISKVDWVNPHIHIHLDVKDESGKVETWTLEGVPVGMARKAGLSKAMLEGHGETVQVVAFPARDGTKNLGFLVKLTYPDGHVFQFSADTSKGS